MTTHKRRTSKLELEPNPFEQSFSRVRSSENIAESLLESKARRSPSTSSSSSSGLHKAKETPPSATANEASIRQKRQEGAAITTPLSAGSSSSSSSRPTQRIILPPVTAITTPLHASKISEAWGPESLRSGPLSPAMLGGPAADSMYKAQPRTTPRLGMSDPLLHTGLTPFMSGETHPVITAGPLETSLATTSGLQAMIHATMNGHEIMATPGGSLHIAARKKRVDRQPVEKEKEKEREREREREDDMEMEMEKEGEEGLPLLMTTGAGNANNLHYELKRPAVETLGVNTAQPEEPRMASTSSRPPPSRAKRARSGNNTSELATTKADKRDAASNSTSTAKLTTTKRTSSGGTRRKPTNNPASTTQLTPPDEAEEGEEGEGEGEDGDGKRQQFLERNRIAALKCRQRKKKQLQELQDRHDYVIMENKRLHAEYMQLREQALQMRALLAAHRECPVAKANGVFGTDSLPLGMSSLSLQQPLLFTNGPESEHAKDIIAAIPPASNGVPVHAIDPVTGNPVNMLPH